jgi:hypothetical protein
MSPTVAEAEHDRGVRCELVVPDGLLAPCEFGAEQPKLSFALIGDSHAARLRAGFSVVARDQGWRGYAITRNSCAFTTAGRTLPEPQYSQCVRWKEQIPAWLARHPEVSTVFVGQLTRDVADFAGTADPFAAKVATYTNAWRLLPPSVKHIVVIRDTPELVEGTLACVDRAVAARQPPGTTCAVPRDTALAPDPAATAATRLASPRFQTIDVTPFFCDRRLCYPVVGGVLAYKDITHVTPQFAETLGPYLLREVQRVSASW